METLLNNSTTTLQDHPIALTLIKQLFSKDKKIVAYRNGKRYGDVFYAGPATKKPFYAFSYYHEWVNLLGETECYPKDEILIKSALDLLVFEKISDDVFHLHFPA